MEKRIIQFVLIVLAVVCIYNFWRPFWRYDLNEAASFGSTEKIVFEVEKGASAKTIAGDLEDADLITSDVSFIRTVESEELDVSLRYGKFVLSPGMTMREIITILTTKGTGEMALTVMEGATIKEIDTQLADLGLIAAGSFKDCTKTCSFDYTFLNKDESLEGFLFPDTYFLDSGNFSSEDLINKMLKNFDEKWTDQMQTDLDSSGRSLAELVNVASMVEKEVRTTADLPIVAGIIWKRLDNEWMLGIDATLRYLDEDGILSNEDLAAENPYNTRINKGLPPTPIGNPSLASLQAALYPQDSEYWFYITDPANGEVIYAKTNAEHEENIAEYLK